MEGRRRRGNKILLIGDYPPPTGGIAVHVRQLHRALLRQGFECRVLDIGKGGKSATDATIIDGRGHLNFGRELLRHASDRFLLHLHTSGHNPKAWTVATSVAVAGQMFGTPTVLTVHSGLVPGAFRKDASLRRRAQVGLVGFSHVVAVSEPIREALADVGVDAARLSTFPAFVASEVNPGPPPPGFEQIRRHRRPLIVAAHHPSPVYGRRALFEAVGRLARRYQDLGLAVFGPGTRDPDVRAEAERFGMASAFEDLGELTHEEALAVMNAADVFVRPTSADGDSVSVREALALGVPCVATDVTVRPDGTILARSDEPGDLARAIERALRTGRRSGDAQPDASRFLRSLYSRLGERREANVAAPNQP